MMMATPDLGRRIIVLGPPGSGKSTLALELSSLLRIPRLMIAPDRLLLDRNEDGTRGIIIVEPPGSEDQLIEELSSLLDIPRLMIGVDRLSLDRREDRAQEIETVLSHLVREDGWVAEGPYFSIPRNVWDRANTVIWLDPSRLLLASRQLKRGWSMRLIRGPRPSGWRRRPWRDLRYTFWQHARDRDGLKGRVEAHRREDMNVIVINTPRKQREFMSSVHNGPLGASDPDQ